MSIPLRTRMLAAVENARDLEELSFHNIQKGESEK